jgi:GntR family transcriptional regulator / MocR family aminotransferase
VRDSTIKSPSARPELSGTALPDFVLRQFDRSLDEFDHQQLYRILQAAIRDALLPPGMRLPSTRAMARDLGVARNTVVHVYEQLTLEGFLHAGTGRGTFVTDLGAGSGSKLVVDPHVRATGSAATLSSRGDLLVQGASAGQLQWGAFTPGVSEVRYFPVQVWNRIQSSAWRHAKPAELSYATGAGDPGLRQALSGHLQRTRGVNCDADQVLVTSGTQQSLLLVTQLLTDPGDTVWIEDPGYWGARSVFQSLGLTIEPIAVDSHGMAPSAEQWRKPPRLIFLSPSHQYPTGAVMNQGRRQQLLDYAARHNAWLLEDDYDSEFRYRSKPLPSLQGQDKSGHVIYLGTFSKTLFPGLGIAYVVLPENLVDPFARVKHEIYRDGRTLQQAVLARFITEGHFAAHIRRMRSVYAARHDALLASIRLHFGSTLPVMGKDAGLHMVLGLPGHVDDFAVSQRALRSGVATRPLSLYSSQTTHAPRGLLLGYGAVPEEEIEANFGLLASSVQSFL